MTDAVLRLYPLPAARLPLRGLYLAHDLRRRAAGRPFLYTNFIASLDGRIAETDSRGRKRVPPAIANARDWRLYSELAAQADALLTTTRYLRSVVEHRLFDLLALAPDLTGWRRERTLSPLPRIAVVGRPHDVPWEALGPELQKRVLLLSGGKEANAAPKGIEAVPVGPGPRSSGSEIMAALTARGVAIVYSIAGPQVHHALWQQRTLDRLYLTVAHRILGGEPADTLVRGPRFEPPPGLGLRSLYLDTDALEGAGQLFACYDRLDRS